jgi:hypothetical protein
MGGSVDIFLSFSLFLYFAASNNGVKRMYKTLTPFSLSLSFWISILLGLVVGVWARGGEDGYTGNGFIYSFAIVHAHHFYFF